MRCVRSYRPVIRARARALRQRGYTHAEICARLGQIPKATLAGWLKDIYLDRQQQQRIHRKIIASAAKGRPLARVAWAKKMARWRRQIETRARPFGTLPFLHPTIGKLVCGIMYLCEGGKYPASRQLMFGNTNPALIRTFLTFLRQYYQVDEGKLRARVIHRWDQKGLLLKAYWSRVTRIPRSQFYPSYADKRTKGIPTRKHDYRGVCCVQYGDTNLQYELQAIGEAVLKAEGGGADGDRTRGLVNAIDALSRLSYRPNGST